jgi:adenylate kinase family enzyme
MGEFPARVMIFGRPGSGKSTFAQALHQTTGIPLYHLDKYFYTANWVERDYKEFLAIQQALVLEESWIIDGNCTRSLAMRYARANLAIYLNYPRYICYGRILKRLFTKNKAIDDRAPGCKETINFKLLRYMWTFHQRVEPSILHLQQQYPATKFVEMRSEKELYFLLPL